MDTPRKHALRWVGCLALCATGILGGCASSPAQTAPTRASSSGATESSESSAANCAAPRPLSLADKRSGLYPFAVTSPGGVVTYPSVGGQVSPAPAGAVPTLTRRQAIAALTADGVGPIQIIRAPSCLRLVDYENIFTTKSSTGVVTPEVPEQLSWFAMYEVPDYGPISLPAGLPTKDYDRPKHSIGTCQLFSAISATTGHTLDGFQYCGPAS